MTHATPDLEVISAFVDDEPFDPEALARALATDAGRGSHKGGSVMGPWMESDFIEARYEAPTAS